jgi:non-specific serine/threonine protein kinase
VAGCLHQLGRLVGLRGEYGSAGELLHEAVTEARHVGRSEIEGVCLQTLADIALAMGDVRGARAWAEEGLARIPAWAEGRRNGCLRTLADTCLEQGEYPAARKFAEQAMENMRAFRLWWFSGSCLITLARVCIEQGDLGRARALLAESLELHRDLGARAGIESTLTECAYLAARQGQTRHAILLAGAAEALRAAIGGSTPTPARRERRRQETLDALQTQLGARAYEAMWAEGRAMCAEQAISCALAVDASTAVQRPARLPDELTAREREVAVLAASGLTNAQIAERLVISERTAQNHLARGFDKLGVHSRAQLAARAEELGLRAQSIQT